jgi:hypothetical protein
MLLLDSKVVKLIYTIVMREILAVQTFCLSFSITALQLDCKQYYGVSS